MGLHDGVRNEGGRDLPTPKPSSVETINSVLSGLDTIKLNIDLALRNWSDKKRAVRSSTHLRILLDFDSENGAIFGFAFPFDILSKVLIPITFRFPESEVMSNMYHSRSIHLTLQD